MVSSTIFVYLGLSYALYGTFFFEKKKMIFHEIFQVCACPNLKNSLLYDRFSIHMYKARSIRYLQQFSYICVSLMPCMVHFLEHAPTCPNLKDSLLYDRFSIHMYKARSIRYLQQFSYICVSFMPCMVHFL